MITRSDILKWVNELRSQSLGMLGHYIETILSDSTYDDKYKVSGIKDIYDEYLRDNFEYDVMELFWYEISNILNGCQCDIYDMARNKDIVGFLSKIYDNELKAFLNANIDRIGIIINVIADVKNNYPFEEDVL